MPEALRYGVAIARIRHARCVIAAFGLAVAMAGCSNSGSSTTTATETMTATVTRTEPPTGSTAAATTPPATTPKRLAGYCETTAVCDDFTSPTGNIKCYATSGQDGFVECTIGTGLTPPPAPSSCDLDQPGLVLPAAGKATPSCRGDPSPAALDHDIPVLAYGDAWRGFGILCLSRASGMTCSNSDGHRFFLSRQRWTIS